MLHKLFIISGPSGTGKTTIMRSVMHNEIVSFTTRKKREGEIDGIDYIFLPVEKFDELKNNKELIEYVVYSGNYYGIEKREVENKLKKAPAFAIVDFSGMRQLSALYPNNTKIFFKTSAESAIARMRKRGDSTEDIKRRLATYNTELRNSIYYDYVVTNNDGFEYYTKKIVSMIVNFEIEFTNN